MTIVTLVSGCGNAYPGALGVGRVLVSTDTFGVSAAVLLESRRRAKRSLAAAISARVSQR